MRTKWFAILVVSILAPVVSHADYDSEVERLKEITAPLLEGKAGRGKGSDRTFKEIVKDLEKTLDKLGQDGKKNADWVRKIDDKQQEINKMIKGQLARTLLEEKFAKDKADRAKKGYEAALKARPFPPVDTNFKKSKVQACNANYDDVRTMDAFDQANMKPLKNELDEFAKDENEKARKAHQEKIVSILTALKENALKLTNKIGDKDAPQSDVTKRKTFDQKVQDQNYADTYKKQIATLAQEKAKFADAMLEFFTGDKDHESGLSVFAIAGKMSQVFTASIQGRVNALLGPAEALAQNCEILKDRYVTKGSRQVIEAATIAQKGKETAYLTYMKSEAPKEADAIECVNATGAINSAADPAKQMAAAMGNATEVGPLVGMMAQATGLSTNITGQVAGMLDQARQACEAADKLNKDAKEYVTRHRQMQQQDQNRELGLASAGNRRQRGRSGQGRQGGSDQVAGGSGGRGTHGRGDGT